MSRIFSADEDRLIIGKKSYGNFRICLEGQFKDAYKPINKMKTLDRKNRVNRIRANAGEDLGLLVNLLRQEKIGYKMLLRNVVEIVNDDYELVVQAVFNITNINPRII